MIKYEGEIRKNYSTKKCQFLNREGKLVYMGKRFGSWGERESMKKYEGEMRKKIVKNRELRPGFL